MERLQKFVSECGLMSRRAAEKEIENGSFTINGMTAALGDKVDPLRDVVMYRGKKLKPENKKYYIMLNKPSGYVTTASDELGRPDVCGLVDIPARLYPVGRLDKNSEGLLFLTNDGDFAARLTHPRYHLKKRYIVITDGLASNNSLDKLRGMRNLGDEKILPVDLSVIERSQSSSKLVFTLSEGKNRQIRRMCEEAGLKIMQLKRISIGNIYMDKLAPGKWRNLTKEEIKELTK